MGPPIPKPGLFGSPASPSPATDQGAGLVSALGPGAPSSLAGSLRQSGLALSRTQPTETPLCTPHRPTWKMNGSSTLRGPPPLGGAVVEVREQSRVGPPARSRCGEAQVQAQVQFGGVVATWGQGPGSLHFWGLCLPAWPPLFPRGPGGPLVWKRPILSD